jgi:uncharacterized membrane protein YdjX (TVP38/TMEM64 family)
LELRKDSPVTDIISITGKSFNTSVNIYQYYRLIGGPSVMNVDQKQNKMALGLNIFLLALFLAAIVYFSTKYYPGIIKILRSKDSFRDFLASYKSISILVFILMQIIQVVVAIIPGEVVQLAGGYVYGTFLGTVYSMTGIMLGAVITFYISRLLGLRTLKAFISEKTFTKFNFVINNAKSEMVMFILFLIPMMPKDTLVYLAGLTPIKPRDFFLIFAIARFPTILLSSFLGANIQKRDYVPVIVISGIICILVVVCLIYKDKVMEMIHKFFPARKS